MVILLFVGLNVKKLTPQERYKLIGKLIEEIKLRKYFLPNRQSLHLSCEKVSKIWKDTQRILAFLLQ